MKRIWRKFIGIALFLGVMLPEMALAAAEKASPLVLVADTRKLTGLMRWWADLYNESHVWFTVLTVVLIPVIGLLFGVIADIVMSHIGIDLKSRDLAEH
jgi:hypothetical protein